MEFKYYSKHGKIIKKCPGLNEYWYKGELIARGCSISSSDPREEPTKEDWEFCKNNNFLDGNRPKDNVTREELSAVIHRLYKKLK